MKKGLCLIAGLALSISAIAKPLVIAHRGASGYLPEHTLEAAVLAYHQGADYIEQDLVLSKDGIPVVLHDIQLETVTDVEQVFPHRQRKDKHYYAIDFTLAELRQLRVHERRDSSDQQVFPQRYQGSASFRIATFEEHIELVAELNRQFGKSVGWYPEIKSPAWHRQQGQDISRIVLAVLRKHRLDSPDARVYVQCFDFAETQRLRQSLGAKVKLVQLIAENSWQESATDYEQLKTPAGLAQIAEVAQGIGPWIPQLINAQTLQATSLVMDAKKAGLQIHPYTFRSDALPQKVTADTLLSVLFKQLKVDGVFTDFTDVVRKYLDQGVTH